ncbi:MAG: hypothetical protein KatS3mg114_1002 [Planctomycetaceae bacterium]|nr:MAG: hypothetical protein KatS3mg114_1002 [Planctomycetaceae bacterium]
MHLIEQWWLSWLGVEIPEGEGLRWSLQTAPKWPTGWPHWFGLIVAGCVLFSFWWSYRREASTLTTAQRAALVALRTLTFLMAWGLWLQPAVVVSRLGLAPVALLLDTSASMGLVDDPLPLSSAMAPSASQEAAAELKSAPASSHLCRWDKVRQHLLAEDAALLRHLLQEHPLRVYHFGADARVVPPGIVRTAQDLPALVSALQQLSATGAQTRPAEAVRQILADLRGGPPVACVIITDGVASESEADRLSQVAELLRQKGILLIAVPVGSSQPPRDVSISDLVLEDAVYVGDPLVVTGKVHGQGVTREQVTVRLTDRQTGQTLAEEQLKVTENTPTRFELTTRLERAGVWELQVEVTPVPGEQELSNNVLRRRVLVHDEQLRILLIDEAPRYEFRYLKQWCEREPSLALSTLLLEADPEYAREDRTAIPYFPAQKNELWRYHVVVLGDVAPSHLSGVAAEWLAEYVREGGGGLVLVSGSRHNPQAFVSTALENLLPFPPGGLLEGGGVRDGSAEAYRLQLTLDGMQGVPLFRWGDSGDPISSQNLAGFYGFVPIRRLKIGVRVLAEHPTRHGELGRLPIITLQQVGAGRVLFHATDETWRWRYRVGDRYFGRYWGQAFRYLSRGYAQRHAQPAELIVERQTFRLGEAVTLRLRILDERLLSRLRDGVKVLLERAGEAAQREIELLALPQLPTVFEATLRGLPAGDYHAWLTHPAWVNPSPAVDFRIEQTSRELQQRAADRHDLQRAVELSGGVLLEVTELERLPEHLPAGLAVPLDQGRVFPLWNRWEPLLLMMMLLTAEWVLRRWWLLV